MFISFVWAQKQSSVIQDLSLLIKTCCVWCTFKFTDTHQQVVHGCTKKIHPKKKKIININCFLVTATLRNNKSIIALAGKEKRHFTDIKTVWTCQTDLEHPEGGEKHTNGSLRLRDVTGTRVWTDSEPRRRCHRGCTVCVESPAWALSLY